MINPQNYMPITDCLHVFYLQLPNGLRLHYVRCAAINYEPRQLFAKLSGSFQLFTLATAEPANPQRFDFLKTATPPKTNMFVCLNSTNLRPSKIITNNSTILGNLKILNSCMHTLIFQCPGGKQLRHAISKSHFQSSN